MTADVTAASSPIQFGDGAEYLMSPLTDRDIVELDEWIQVRYVERVMASLSADASQEERDRMRLSATHAATGMTWMSGDGARVMATIEGMTRLLWQSLRREHPSLTPDELRKHMYSPENLRAVRERFERLNSPPQGKEEARRDRRRRRALKSTGGSRDSTRGSRRTRSRR